MTLPEPGTITVEVVNDGRDEVTIAQVLIDDAYWSFTSDNPRPLKRLESATLTIPYPWVQDEAHAIALVSSTGALFEAEIPVAFESPEADRSSVVRFGLVGLYVGVIPILTALVGFCPAYALLGLSTCSMKPQA